MSNPAKGQKSARDWGIVQKKRHDGGYDWYARIARIDSNGKVKQFSAKAENKSHAKRLRDELIARFDDHGERAIDGARMTFRELAEEYGGRKIIPPKYHEDRKVAGLRSYKHAEGLLTTLIDHFGSRKISDIRPADLERYKQLRLDKPVEIRTRRGSEHTIRRARAIASVNRELTLLRTIFNDAVRNGWLARSPFASLKGLISSADERKRDRVLAFEEEELLLDACVVDSVVRYNRNGEELEARIKTKRRHLKPLLVTALDTAMRRGEILKLVWRDVDFASKTITILARNTKTATMRTVGMTSRVRDELWALWETSAKDPDDLVFGIKDTFKRSFSSACRDAGIDDFKFHDCRHTAITRMIQAGLSPMEVMKISGHTQASTFARYVNPNTQAVQRIATILDDFNCRSRNTPSESALVN